jgi:two-component system, chemotaxis family, chemotaxis protein CheY
MNTLSHCYPIDQNIPCILFVEDDLEDQMLLKMAFDNTMKEVSLYFVCNAYEAMEYLQQAPDHTLPNLIVLDINLPGLDGVRFKQQLNTIEQYSDIKKVLLSTSNHFPGLTQMSTKCFIKPDTFEGLVHLAENLLQLCDAKTT